MNFRDLGARLTTIRMMQRVAIVGFTLCLPCGHDGMQSQ